MKRTLLSLAAALACAINATAQSDTLVVNHPDKVNVCTSGDTLSINILGSKDNPDYFYQKTVMIDSDKEVVTSTSQDISTSIGWDFSLVEKDKSDMVLDLYFCPQFSLGWNIPLGKPADMKLKGIRSGEFGLDICRFRYIPSGSRWKFCLYYGFLFNRYVFKKSMMTSSSDGNVFFTPYPDEVNSRSSATNALSSNLTLMTHYQLKKNREVGLGIALTNPLMMHCLYKSKYKLPDGTSVVDMYELPMRRSLFSIKAEYMFRQFGFYLRYTPMSILKKDKGPSFQQLSLGLQMKF